MSNTAQCEEEVWEAPGYWHSHQCTNKAKWVVSGRSGDSYPKLICGLHVKVARRHQKTWPDITIEPWKQDTAS